MTGISSYALVDPGCLIYDNVFIGPFCSIGLPGEVKTIWEQALAGKVIIMDQTIITGHVTIDSGTKANTIIGSGCFIMKHVHIGHDAQIGNRVILSPGARIGGQVIINNDVNVGMNAVIHQQVEIPEKCMIGMGSVITVKAAAQMKPGETWAGNPAKKIGMNKRWIK